MKCQNLFSGKNKKNITSLSSAELAQLLVKVNTPLCFFFFFFFFFFSGETNISFLLVDELRAVIF